MSNRCIVVVQLDFQEKSQCSHISLVTGKRVRLDELQNNKRTKAQTKTHNSLHWYAKFPKDKINLTCQLKFFTHRRKLHKMKIKVLT